VAGDGYRFAAFVSYRHVEPDRAWAQWLHRFTKPQTETAALSSEWYVGTGAPPGKIANVAKYEKLAILAILAT
jgi:hypothetical protein